MGRPTSLVLFLFIFGKIYLSVKGKAGLTIVFSRILGVRVVCDLFPPERKLNTNALGKRSHFHNVECGKYLFFPVEHSVHVNVPFYFLFTWEEMFDISSPVYSLYLMETSCHTPHLDKFSLFVMAKFIKSKIVSTDD